MKPIHCIVAIAALTVLALCGQARQAASPFIVKPYVQLGDAPALSAPEHLTLVWHTSDAPGEWAVETRADARAQWTRSAPPAFQRVAVGSVPSHRVWTADLAGLAPGLAFEYRVLQGGQPVFQATARARKSAAQPYRFVAFGDCGEGTPGQRQIAYQAWRLRPDFVFIPGDIVYGNGGASQYRDRFFPVYNADAPSPTTGVPLMRSTLFMAAPGNEDVAMADLGAVPDGLAYFLYWRQPLNGPPGTLRAPHTPGVRGPDASVRSFLAGAAPRYPQMASFSFDYGNSHWTVLDSDPYADWTKPPLHDWLEADLAAAKGATWRIVAFHHAAFNAPDRLVDLPRIEAVARLCEKYHVDVVLNGHLHTYLCSWPLKLGAGGQWAADTQFDGKTRTRASGTIWLISGAGGAHLHQLGGKEMLFWQLLARRYVPGQFSLTVVDVNGRALTVRQVGAQGQELDRFVLTH